MGGGGVGWIGWRGAESHSPCLLNIRGLLSMLLGHLQVALREQDQGGWVCNNREVWVRYCATRQGAHAPVAPPARTWKSREGGGMHSHAPSCLTSRMNLQNDSLCPFSRPPYVRTYVSEMVYAHRHGLPYHHHMHYPGCLIAGHGPQLGEMHCNTATHAGVSGHTRKVHNAQTCMVVRVNRPQISTARQSGGSHTSSSDASMQNPTPTPTSSSGTCTVLYWVLLFCFNLSIQSSGSTQYSIARSHAAHWPRPRQVQARAAKTPR